MKVVGYVVIAILFVQIYYIILHYNDIVTYVSTYKNYRYGIDIVPQYIDPSTADFNDTISADVKTKRRCVLRGSSYVIVSLNGYAVDDSNTILTYPLLLSCIIDMTENYSNFLLSNPCLVNSSSPSCLSMLSLLNV